MSFIAITFCFLLFSLLIQLLLTKEEYLGTKGSDFYVEFNQKPKDIFSDMFNGDSSLIGIGSNKPSANVVN